MPEGSNKIRDSCLIISTSQEKWKALTSASQFNIFNQKKWTLLKRAKKKNPKIFKILLILYFAVTILFVREKYNISGVQNIFPKFFLGPILTWPCLVIMFKQRKLLIKHHNTYFYPFFYPHAFPQILNNIIKNLLPNRP